MMPKPNSEQLSEDIAFYKKKGINKVLSLLLPEEIVKLGLKEEAKACEEAGLEFLNFSIKDMSVPDITELKKLHSGLKQDLANGKSIAIHCHGGRGRAGTVAITLMLEHGYEVNEAIKIASEGRKDKVPVNDIQTNFVLNYKH